MKILMIVALAASVAAQSVPLPRALLTAKTLSVVNAGVDQDEYDWFVQEMRGWQRFTVVDEEADVTATIMIVRRWPRVTRVTFTHGETVLYSDSLSGCCTFRARLRSALERLEKRLRRESPR